MGLFDGLRNRKKPKKGAINLPAMFQQLFLQRTGLVNTYDDDIRTYIERGYQENPVVYAAVNMIAKNVAKAKWKLVNSSGDEVKNRLLSELIFQPNPLQKWSDLNESLATHYLLEGNAFITGEYGSGVNSGKYNSLYVLPSEDIQIIASTDYRGIRGYRVDFAWSEGTEIPATDVLHLRTPNPDYDESDNWLFGQSPFRAASKQIQTYNEAQDAGVWFQQNKGAQKILVTDDSEVDLSPEAADLFKKKLRAQSQGANNNGNIPIFDQKLKSIDISSNAADALVLEQMKYSAQQIVNVINFPGQLIGLSDATYQNAKEAKKGLWENCVIPLLDELCHGYNRWLTPQFGDVWLEYDVSHIDALQEDKLMRGEAINKFAGMITVNQALEMAGLPTYDWMQAPTNMDEFREQMYVGFTQAVVRDDEEISPINGEPNNTEDGEE